MSYKKRASFEEEERKKKGNAMKRQYYKEDKKGGLKNTRISPELISCSDILASLDSRKLLSHGSTPINAKEKTAV